MSGVWSYLPILHSSVGYRLDVWCKGSRLTLMRKRPKDQKIQALNQGYCLRKYENNDKVTLSMFSSSLVKHIDFKSQKCS